jgi:hypothetical protein
MSFEIEGVLHKIFPTEQKTESFRTREFVIVFEQGAYPQYIKFQLVQDRCDLIDTYQEGAKIKVHFDLRGREWNEKFFTNLSAWRIEAIETSGPASDDSLSQPSFPEEIGTSSTEGDNMAEDFDDLPF